MIRLDGIIDEAEYVWMRRLEVNYGCLHDWRNRAPRMLCAFATVLSACFGVVNSRWSLQVATNSRNLPSGIALQDGRREGFINLDLTHSRLTVTESSTGKEVGGVSTARDYTEAPDLLARAVHDFFAAGREAAADAAD